jgi:hypothetical protein
MTEKNKRNFEGLKETEIVKQRLEEEKKIRTNTPRSYK